MQIALLTTIDNPFNPISNWDEWYAFDKEKGYNTCEYLARVGNVSDELSDADEEAAIDAAIDEILSMNINGLYRKIIVDSEIAYASNE